MDAAAELGERQATPPLTAGARAGGMRPPAPHALVLDTSTAPECDVLDGTEERDCLAALSHGLAPPVPAREG